MTDRQRRQHERRERQLRRQAELRQNALYFAAAGERLAAFTATLLDSALWPASYADAPMPVTCTQRRKQVKELAGDIVRMASDAEIILEPFRGRVHLGELDEWWSTFDEALEEAEQPTQVPEAFNEALDGDEPD